MEKKIYVINLPHSNERRRLMEKQLKDIDIPHEICEAIWGRDLSEACCEKIANGNRSMTKNELAIVLSHKKAMQKAIEDEVDYIIIMEDDVIIKKEFDAIIDGILKVITDGDIYLLYAAFLPCDKGKMERVKFLQTNTWLLKLRNDSSKLWMAAGYILKTGTAKKLADGLVPIQCPMDDWLTYKKQNLINDVFVTYPFTIKHASLPSENVDEQGRNGVIASWVIRNRRRVPPLFKLFVKWRQIKEHRAANDGIQASIQS